MYHISVALALVVAVALFIGIVIGAWLLTAPVGKAGHSRRSPISRQYMGVRTSHATTTRYADATMGLSEEEINS